MSPKTYEASWNELSWEVSAAADAFFAMTAVLDYHVKLVEKIGRSEQVRASPFMASVAVISDSLVTYFFIAACRIREQKRSTLNLVQLLITAKDLGILSVDDQSHADELIARTEHMYGKLKKARGMAVAHLQTPQNPLQILRTESVTRADVLSYLADCDNLLWLLGKPIGKTPVHEIAAHGARIAEEVKRMLGVLWLQ
jgi:hypothetical protein